jgi:hypothetical protein
MFLDEMKQSIFGFDALLNDKMLWDGARNVLPLSRFSKESSEDKPL